MYDEKFSRLCICWERVKKEDSDLSPQADLSPSIQCEVLGKEVEVHVVQDVSSEEGHSLVWPTPAPENGHILGGDIHSAGPRLRGASAL